MRCMLVTWRGDCAQGMSVTVYAVQVLVVHRLFWFRRLAVEITEVRIKLIEDGGERLHAFCSITFDDSFVVRDLKIIEGTHGPFVAMPSRKLTAHCPQCGMKNHLRSAYCNQCGSRQKEERPAKDEDGRTKLYADIAHPINSACREMIQQRVIREYRTN